jgi:hypothetical protein
VAFGVLELEIGGDVSGLEGAVLVGLEHVAAELLDCCGSTSRVGAVVGFPS